MKIEVKVTPKDYGEFNEYYLKHKLVNKRTLLLVSLLVFFLTLIASFGQKFSILSFTKDILITAFIFITTYFIMTFLTSKLAEYLPNRNGSIIGQRVFICTDEYFIEESPESLKQQKWSSILSVEESKNILLIFIDSIVAHIIPKRDFKNEEEKTAFIEFVKSKISREK